ncbi:MAG: hypothetical protein NVS4B12_24910 [Ktedonobacteraceae bacterium]
MDNTIHAFHAWDFSEDALLQARYASGEDIVQIAEVHQRTVAEIKARIIQLRIKPNFYASTSSTQVRDTTRKKDNERATLEPVKVNPLMGPTIVKQDLPINAGKKWDAEQERALVNSFTAGMSISSIAQFYGRTVGSITSRLFRLGLMNDSSASCDTKTLEPPTLHVILTSTSQIDDYDFPF